ncbi:MAG: PAS domain S-box protein, partial [Flavobacteriaceae bacterium]|nr:PAS domain S-box protein [Flavobacteriaceae bacterium]
LGKSESIGVAADLFVKVDKHKLFRKAEATLGYQLKFSRLNQRLSRTEERKRNEIRNMSIVDVAKETLYHKFENPFVIINASAEIKEVHGSLRLYLEIGQGTMNANIYKMVNSELITVLKAQVSQVKKTGVQHTSHVVKFNLYDTIHYVKLRTVPLIYTIGDVQYFMVIFEKVLMDEETVELQKKLETTDFTDLRVKELEEELEATKEHLQIFTEELEAANEELQTMNEELQSSNEELKSSNEELETSNEELQSANEELNTANNELRLSNEAMLEKEEELRKEKELSERNEKIYKSIAENIPNGTVGILNEKFEILYLAGEGLRAYDFKADELMGQNLINLNPSKKERAKLKKVFQKTLEGYPGSIEFTYGDKYYHLQTVPLTLNEGSEQKIMYLSQNITEQKVRETKLNIAIDAADLIIYEWNAQTDIFENAPKLNEFLNIDPNTTMTGDLFMEQIESEDHPHIWQEWKNSEKTGMVSFEGRLKASKFGTKWIKVLGKVLYDENQEIDRVIATLMDITREKQLLEATKSRAEQFREISNTVPAIIWISDRNKNTTFLNDNWYEYTGGTPATDLEKGWLHRVHPEDRAKTLNIFDTSFDKRSKFKLEFRLKNRDDSYCWFINQGRPMIDDSGVFKGFIGSCVDINDRKEFTDKLEDMVQKRTQELNEANEELVKVNMNLEEYAYVTSHDLQEPIRKIRTFNSILQDNIKNGEALEYSKKIEKSAERMTALVNNVLDYSKLSNLTALKEKVDLNHIIDNIMDDLELLIDDKKASIEY